jgi:hypothetical protein
MKDGDRHTGNYLYDPTTGSVKIIDMGFAGETNSKVYNVGGSQLTQWRARAQGISPKQLTFDRQSLLDVLSQKDACLSALQTSGMPASQMRGFQARFAVLEKWSQSPTLTAGGLEQVSDR